MQKYIIWLIMIEINHNAKAFLMWLLSIRSHLRRISECDRHSPRFAPASRAQ